MLHIGCHEKVAHSGPGDGHYGPNMGNISWNLLQLFGDLPTLYDIPANDPGSGSTPSPTS